MVKVTVTNTGDRVGEEVAQLYIRDLVATYVRPVRELKGFKKILLEPGEAQVVNFELTEKELGYYSPGGAFMVEPGTFEVMVGPNSQIGLLDRFELK
ncbi:MAG: fibronectin type III-like domain-contianing protein [Bacteroidota bacterium]